ncbi:MAG: hypothetical protein EOO43_09355 [Flavobacterium sp.]|nr:MAG: hypothetical protein EOO43_09355 [Flavobacterium sp.]
MPPIELGDVFAVQFEGIDHDKYIVVVGITELGSFICSAFINSKIHQFIIDKRPHLVRLHIPITQNNNRFLSHDSFIGCDDCKKVSVEKMNNLFAAGMCRPLGKLNSDDFAAVRAAVIDSDLLSPEELQYYFQIPIP